MFKRWKAARRKVGVKAKVCIAGSLAAVSTLTLAGAANADIFHGHWIGGKILEEYQEAGGWSYFGDALNPESNASRGGRWQQYANDKSIYWHPLVTNGHANAIGGAIRVKWGDMGWENGDLKYPTTRELPTNPFKPGRFNHFEGGSIYWSTATGANPVWGSIREKWASKGWEMSALGFPKSGEFITAGNGRGQEFQTGWIYWGPNVGTYSVLRPIMDVWGANNWENGTYGYPVEDTRGPGCSRYSQRFQNGIIVTDPDPYLTSYPNSVDGSEIAFQTNFGDPKSATAWNAAVTEWNKLGKINVKQGGAFGYDLTVNDVNLSDVDWAGRYQNYGPLPDQIMLNKFYTDNYSAPRRQATMVHEIGHALGLDHSCSTQIMGPGDIRDQSLSTPQALDIDLYRYKWGY